MEHDYKTARRGAVIQSTGKTRVTMYLDDDVLDFFRERATKLGRGYQTIINSELRGLMEGTAEAGEIVTLTIRDEMSDLVRTMHEIKKEVVEVKGFVSRKTSGRFTYVKEGNLRSGSATVKEPSKPAKRPVKRA